MRMSPRIPCCSNTDAALSGGAACATLNMVEFFALRAACSIKRFHIVYLRKSYDF